MNELRIFRWGTTPQIVLCFPALFLTLLMTEQPMICDAN